MCTFLHYSIRYILCEQIKKGGEIFEENNDFAYCSGDFCNDSIAMLRSVSYPNNKAKHLVGMAQMLVKEFNSEVPDTLEELVKLPGVGRKTANVIQSVVFNKAAMAVDTHVFRVSHRLGLVSDKCTTPFSVEKELVKHIPETDIPIAHHWLILHGRYVCQARTPQCDTCGLQLMCKYYCQKYKVSKESGKDKE